MMKSKVKKFETILIILSIVMIGGIMCLCGCGSAGEKHQPLDEQQKDVTMRFFSGEVRIRASAGKALLYKKAGETVVLETVPEYVESTELQEKRQEQQTDEITDDYKRIAACLIEQVPEIKAWTDYVTDKSGGKASLYIRPTLELEDIYRDYEGTEYLGKYYYVYVGELWEDHSAHWESFYVSENFDEVLWYDITMTEEYSVLYLDE